MTIPEDSEAFDTRKGRMLNKSRQDTLDDEHRLFANFEYVGLRNSIVDEHYTYTIPSRKPSDETIIKPGLTFRPLARKNLQSFARLTPLNTLSPNFRESGPVRARGRPRLQTNREVFSTSEPSRYAPSDSDTVERPAKRLRRRISPVTDSIINLVDEEKLQLQKSPLTSSVAVRRKSFISSFSSQHQPQAQRFRDPKNDVDEYRGVEKMMSNGHRKISHYSFSNKDLSLTPDDNHEESFTRVAAKQRRSQPSSPPTDAAAGISGNLPIIESVEIHSANASCDEKDREKASTLQRQFVRTDGRRRVSDMRESPDELQGDVTVAPAPASLDSNCKRNNSTHPRSSRRNSSEAEEDVRQPFPNDIQPTIFMNPSQEQQTRGGKSQKTSWKGSRLRLFKASLFRFGGVERVPSSESAVEFVLDKAHQTLELADGNECETVGNVTVPLQKVTRVFQGLDDSRKIQLQLSKSEGFLDERVDIEFVSQKDKADMCNLLASKAVTVQDKPSDWMDKLFKRSREIPARQVKTSKRPSTETIRDPVSEIKVEPVKRQKLSTSLQDDDGNVKPAAFNSKLTLKFPVAKSRIPLSNVRETRSKSRRTIVSLIGEDAGSAPKSAPDDSIPKWPRPLVYPRQGKKKAEVDSHDLERLRDGEFLNDNLIGFYLRFLEHHLERTRPEVARRVYFFNSYFFATLTNAPKGKRAINYQGVQKWTRNVDIFGQDYVIVPINEKAHWYVAIICNLPGLHRTLDNTPEVEELGKIINGLSAQSDGVEVPGTPPGVSDNELSDTPNKTDGVQVETAKEETARQSLASLTLSDSKHTDTPGPSRTTLNDSEDDWPEKEENPTSSPPIFFNANKEPRLAERNNLKAQGEQFKGSPPRSEKKRKKKAAPPLPKYDAKQPIIITFDSLNLARSPTIRILREYLQEEARSKRAIQIDAKDIRGMTARAIPLQPNFSDCGLYLLAYLEKFVQDPDVFIRKLLQREMDATADWPPLKSGLLRQRLRKFLLELQDEQENSKLKMGFEKALVDRQPISFLLGTEDSVQPLVGYDDTIKKLDFDDAEVKDNPSNPQGSSPDRCDHDSGRQGTTLGDIIVRPNYGNEETEIIPDKYTEDSAVIESKADGPLAEQSPSIKKLIDIPESQPSESEQQPSDRLKDMQGSKSPKIVTSDEKYLHSDEKLFNEIYEMTDPTKEIALYVQVPGTPLGTSEATQDEFPVNQSG
ncbi:hypothetical protein Egran_03544 [Elaphomyces granulatus]|uniref:Ubiquitin-like protease family profile domain-containing protein n=1 Tax=Elaphomyces granulatus TaxID=519963 RepID=A0A232LXD3_9EURO|nr:hypothetical protein Egran_03544 [Elaphomyces granulatus]